MSITNKPVGGIIGKRPVGASFRTGVWKIDEVYERRVDGVWATPSYPDLAPYATNANGEILVATYNPGKKNIVGNTQTTQEYVRPIVKYSAGGKCLDDSRWNYVYTQAVSLGLNWKFTMRYYDEPTGSNVFGLTPQNNNLRSISSGNSCHNMNSFRSDYEVSGNFDGLNVRYMWHDEASGCDATGVDYNLLGTSGSSFSYTTTTTGGPSSSRWPFGAATENRYEFFNGNVSYTNFSETQRPVSMWLIPPP